MKHMNGDMFTSDAKAIGHGCNTVGAMGAGVAAIVRRKFPFTHETYVYACAQHGVAGGDVLVTGPENGQFVFNMMTQIAPGPDARLDLVAIAAADAVDKALTLGLDRIAIPQIGCGIGGLTWDEVQPLLEATERDGFQWEVWTL